MEVVIDEKKFTSYRHAMLCWSICGCIRVPSSDPRHRRSNPRRRRLPPPYRCVTC